MEQNSQHNPNTPEGDRRAEGKLEHWSPVTEAMRPHPDQPRTKRGNPIDPADRGSPVSRVMAIVATVFVVVFVVLWQNTPDPTKEAILFGKSSVEAEPAPSPDQPAPGAYGNVDLMGRLFLRGVPEFQDFNIMRQIEGDGMVFSDEDRLRLVMISAEFEGTDRALDRLEAFRLEHIGLDGLEEIDTQPIDETNDETTEPTAEAIDEDRETREDEDDLILLEIDALRTIYALGPDALSGDQAQQLRDRYGYIGQVALTHGLPQTDETRDRLTNRFAPLAVLFLCVLCVVVIGPLLGLVLLILGIVQYAGGRLRMRARVPRPGGSVYLETYAVFVLGFCVMAVSTFLIAHSSYPELASFSIIAQWLLLLTVFWALVRGTRFDDWKLATGWNTGEGVLKEIGCGIICYLAALPLYILGVIVTVVLMFIQQLFQSGGPGGGEPAGVSNPVFEIIAHADLFIIIFLFLLATTWAPIVEESIFRGALHRFFRARLHWIPVAIITAILFAYMHDYGPLMVAPLIALGFMFSFMREWRGSLIAPVTAHFLHNFSLMLFMITLVQLIKDPPV